MLLAELARQRADLRKISLHRKNAIGAIPHIVAATLQFGNGHHLVLSTNHETDELMWGKPPEQGLETVDASEISPLLRAATGLRLTWAWEMTNHQGYFDAVQIELTTPDLVHAMTLQFKVAASNIELYLLERVPSKNRV